MNLPIKFGTNPSTIVLVIVVTDQHTHTNRQTNAGKNILPRFRGENYVGSPYCQAKMCAAPSPVGCVTVSMPTGQTDRRKNGRTQDQRPAQ